MMRDDMAVGDWDMQRYWIVSMGRFTGKRIELVRRMAILDWVVLEIYLDVPFDRMDGRYGYFMELTLGVMVTW